MSKAFAVTTSAKGSLSDPHAMQLLCSNAGNRFLSERIRQPRQSRSQDTMIRFLVGFEKLLRKGGYETITINDLAKEPSTGAGSNYARFAGKRSILLAVHARARGRARRYFHSLFNPAANSGETLEAAVEHITQRMFLWHKRTRNFIKASLLLDDVDIYRGTSTSFHPWNQRLAQMLMAREPALPDPRLSSRFHAWADIAAGVWRGHDLSRMLELARL